MIPNKGLNGCRKRREEYKFGVFERVILGFAERVTGSLDKLNCYTFQIILPVNDLYTLWKLYQSYTSPFIRNYFNSNCMIFRYS